MLDIALVIIIIPPHPFTHEQNVKSYLNYINYTTIFCTFTYEMPHSHMDPASSKNPPPHLHNVKLIVMSLSLSQGKDTGRVGSLSLWAKKRRKKMMMMMMMLMKSNKKMMLIMTEKIKMNKMMMMVGETDERRGVISEMDEKKSLLSSSTLCVSHLPCTFRVLIAQRERELYIELILQIE